MQGKVAALKCMQKAQIVACHQERNIMNEKVGRGSTSEGRGTQIRADRPPPGQNILADCQHPFVLELLTTYTDHDQIYMLMDLVQASSS
jgi:peptide subunit release factor 1 (eRF1)